ncbi:MAG: hypothetical protein HY821_09010 [Acidobacteria bacterium]|nr:hypothetical protein [Acidobacteriota bacterium]
MEVKKETVEIEVIRCSVTCRPDSVERFLHIVFILMLFYAALLLPPVKVSAAGSGVDGSHLFATNYYPNHGVVFGRDVVWTYGPLGYLQDPQDIGNNLVVANAIRMGCWCILLGALGVLGWRGWEDLLRAGTFLLAVVLAGRILLFGFDYFILCAMYALVLVYWRGRGRIAVPILLAALTGVLMLYKFSGYVGALLIVFLHISLNARSWIAEKRIADGAGALAITAAGPMAYLCYHFSFSDLFTYIRGGLELSSGYMETMGLEASFRDSLFALIIIVLFGFQLALGVIRKVTPLPETALLAVMGLLYFKHGFVRADGHVMHFFAMAMVLSAVSFCIQKPGLSGFSWAVPLYCAIAFIGYTALTSIDSGYRPRTWLIAENMRPWEDLTKWPETSARQKAEAEKSSSWANLPVRIRQEIETTRSIVFPQELSYAASGRFQLMPIFVYQGYSVYTPWLDHETALRLTNARPSADYLLLDWESIDGRHPLLDLPATAAAIGGSFEPHILIGNHLLMRRKPHASLPKFQMRARRPLAFGGWIEVPRMRGPTWASISIEPTVRGRVKRTLLRAERLSLEFQIAGGLVESYQVVRRNMATPFPLTKFSPDIEAFHRLQKDRVASFPIERIRIARPKDGADYAQPEIVFWEENDDLVRIERPANGSVVDVLRLTNPNQIPSVLAGGPDTFGGQPLPTPAPSDANPLAIAPRRPLEVAGWVATDGAGGQTFDDVYLTIGMRVFQARATPRPDVGRYFKNAALDQSGFRVSVQPSELPKGTMACYLVGRVRKSGKLYRSSSAIWINVP